MNPLTDLQEAHEIEQFYYHEARLLDSRQLQSWLELLAPGILYTMPTRNYVAVDSSLRNTEAIQNIEQEKSAGIEPPLRYDDLLTLTFRANRATSPQAYAENPLTRTVRLVSNIEPYQTANKTYKVFNNVSLSLSRHQSDNHTIYFSREDEIKKIDGELKLFKREIVLNWNTVTAPSLALIL